MNLIPARGMLLVRPVEVEDTVRGVVRPAQAVARMTSAQAEVISVGEPELCEAEDCTRVHAFRLSTTDAGDVVSGMRVHPCDVKPGDWILCRPRSFIETAEPERKEWFVHQRDVLAILGSA